MFKKFSKKDESFISYSLGAVVGTLLTAGSLIFGLMLFTGLLVGAIVFLFMYVKGYQSQERVKNEENAKCRRILKRLKRRGFQDK